jgi:hypothetical protein
MKGRSGFLITLFCVVALASNAWAISPVLNVVDHPVPRIAERLSIDDVRKNIRLGGLKRHWQFEEIGPGQLKATQADARRRAVISVTDTKTSYSITLLESSSMQQKGESDQRQLQSLGPLSDQDIDDQLSMAAIAGN